MSAWLESMIGLGERDDLRDGDLERRQVVDLLPDRSAASTAKWIKGHPEVEIISRDRAGLYAGGARAGAPQARQVADRFHLLQNFREAVERQLGQFGAPIREAPIGEALQEAERVNDFETAGV